MRHLRGTNQYTVKTDRLFGLKKRVWMNLNLISLIVLPILYFGHQAALHQPIALVSPLASSAWAMDDPLPSISPSPAPLPERQANEALIRKVWGADASLGIKIAYCESGLRTQASNENTDGSEDQGIFQINSVHNMPDMFDATANVSYAYTIYLKQGTTPWNSSKPCWGSEVNN